MALGFISTPIMVRQLGMDLFGVMALLMSIIAPLGLLDFGIGEATIKYVAESLGREDYPAAERYLRATCFFNVSVGLAGAALIIALAPFLVLHAFNISAEHETLAVHCLYWIGGIWCLNQVRQTFIGAITAKQNYRVVSIGMFMTQFFHTGIGLAVLLLGGSLLIMIQLQALAAMLSVLAWYLTARRVLPGLRLSPHFAWPAIRRTSSFGFWQMLNNLCGLLTHQSQRWLLGALMPVSAVGFYNVGNQLVTTVYSATYRVGQVLFPAVSQLQGAKREEEAARLMLQTNWFLTGVVVSGYVGLAVFADGILQLWVGHDFALHSTAGLRVLCLAYATACVFAVPNFYLLGVGRPKWLSYLSLSQGVVTLSVAYPFVLHWGVVGAAAAIGCGTLVQVVAVALMWRPMFSQWIKWRTYFAASFGPLFVGLLMGVLLFQVRLLTAWTPRGLLMIVSIIACCLLVWTTIQAVNLSLPEGISRWRSMILTAYEVTISLRRRLRLA
jgi:O-antigen/teichoic acid export membrane protein